MNIIEGILVLIMAALVAVLVGAAAYGITYLFTPYGPNFTVNASVKNISYTSAETSTGTGFSSGGRMVVTTNSTPERHNVVFKLENGKLWVVNNKTLFADASVGEALILTVRSKRVWGGDNWNLVSWERASK